MKEEVRDRPSIGSSTAAQIMTQIDQELDQAKDRQVLQASQPVPAPQPVSYSPMLQDMRNSLTDAKMNQRLANNL